MNVTLRTCGTSSEAGDLFRLRSNGEITPLTPLHCALTDSSTWPELVSSLESVYEPRRYIPCENRFSTLAWNEWYVELPAFSLSPLRREQNCGKGKSACATDGAQPAPMS